MLVFGIKKINPRNKYKHIISIGAAYFTYDWYTYRNCDYATTEQVFYKHFFLKHWHPSLQNSGGIFFNGTCINVKN